MTTPGRRGGGGGGGGGKSRGRGGSGHGGGRGGGADAKGKKRDKSAAKRGRGNGGGGRGGGGGNSSGGADAKAGSSGAGASSSSARPTRAVTTVLKKVVVRNIPHSATEEEVRQVLESHGVGSHFIWRFVPGRTRANNRAPVPSRMYLDMKKDPERARKLIAALHGQSFSTDAKVNNGESPLVVEFAPFQKIPREKQRKDAKVGTIDRDPEYLAFLEELEKPRDKLPSAEVVADLAEGETPEKPVATLVKYLNERKVHGREKGKGKSGSKGFDKNGARRQSRKKDGSKQKNAKDKTKSSKKKSNADAANGRDSVKTRKARNGKKKESAKQEALQPGMLRIMAPKNGTATEAAAGSGGKATASPSSEATSERGAEKRGSKGGKKGSDANGARNRGRGRGAKGPKGGGDGGEGDGGAAAATESKARPRRGDSRAGGANSSKKESGNRGERKKKAFAPKDSTAQGTLFKG